MKIDRIWRSLATRPAGAQWNHRAQVGSLHGRGSAGCIIGIREPRSHVIEQLASERAHEPFREAVSAKENEERSASVEAARLVQRRSLCDDAQGRRLHPAGDSWSRTEMR